MREPRILLFDIENSATKAWVWSCYQTDVIKVIEPWYLLSFAWKWLGEDKAHVRCLRDYKSSYKDNPKDDMALTRDLHELMNQADVSVTHNGNGHDTPKAMSRFAYHRLGPPRRPKQVDTYQILKRELKIEKNSLDHAAEYFGIGHKLPNTGFNMWERCTEGTQLFTKREVNEAWDMMCQYNLHDVDPLLEGVYLALRPYSKAHPNLNFITRDDACPVCQSNNLHRDGFSHLASGRKQRWECIDCGHRFTAGKIIREAV